eukprot:5975866-Pleurochrysis_carterae.AAC.2
MSSCVRRKERQMAEGEWWLRSGRGREARGQTAGKWTKVARRSQAWQQQEVANERVISRWTRKERERTTSK